MSPNKIDFPLCEIDSGAFKFNSESGCLPSKASSPFDLLCPLIQTLTLTPNNALLANMDMWGDSSKKRALSKINATLK